ncbi:hypothetical protein FBU30_010804 [Linnemannia zychae]|nr:hypothetical protein FBU30_010804 [Linnemannia zychae]
MLNDDKILVYRFATLTPTALPILVDRISDPRSIDDETSMDRTINIIQVGYLGTEEVLVTANDAGEACVWFTSNLRRDPLLLSVTESAWGVAIHSERRLIAISTNAHTVTIFHCGTNSRISSRRYSSNAPTFTGSTTAEGSPPSFNPNLLSATDEPSTSQQILSGHDHNIPCVTFSPCGRFVATSSIDRTCRTWRLSDGKQIQQKSLGPLWGWGVRFVPKMAWMTITKTEYRRIPKDHLLPGKHPGMNVRDSPFSTTAFSQRRFPPGRDLRMIRTRWYAGPVHEDRARWRNQGEGSTGVSRNRTTEVDNNEQQEDEETDDRDAALFGMDDDEDEWEDTSSSDTDGQDGQNEQDERNTSTTQQQQHPLVRSPTGRHNIGPRTTSNSSHTTSSLPNIPRPSSIEVSADTGDDGDNEGTGMDTEDAAGTAGESSSSALRTVRERKLERRSLLSMKALDIQHSRDHGESSSEQEQTTRDPSTPRLETETDTKGTSESSYIKPEEIKLGPSEFQPITTSTFRNKGPFENLVHVTPFQSVKKPPTAPLMTPPTRPLSPKYPEELLLCATARNIYLLSQYPLASEIEQEQQPTISLLPYSTEVVSITLLDENNQDGDDEMTITGDITTNGEWIEEQDLQSHDEDNDDNAHQHHHHHDEDDDVNDDSSDISDDSENSESENSDIESVSHSRDSLGDIGLLHTLTVARSAATRADGRRYHRLEHYDRLFVMELVPELSILIAASQKGTVTIFRLLRVLDESPPSTPAAAAGGGSSSPTKKPKTSPSITSQSSSSDPIPSQQESQDTTLHRDKRLKKGKDKHDKGHRPHSHKEKKNIHPTIQIQGVHYVLFPEVYLPRLEPTFFPLYGVSVVPLQPSKPMSYASRDNTQTRRHESTEPSVAMAPTSFILHLMYMDSQFYSYELRLRNDKDDPVRLGNIFV